MRGHEEFVQRTHDFDAAEAALNNGDPGARERMEQALQAMKDQRDANARAWGVKR